MTTPADGTATPVERAPAPGRALRVDAWDRFRHHRLAVVAATVLGVVVLAVLIGPLLVAADADGIELAARNQAPSLAHPMGTDQLGRDQLARVLEGGRLTVAVAASAVVAALLIGVLVGAVAGYAGGVVDNVAMRVADVFYSVPSLFVVILLVALVGPSFGVIVTAIALFSWMNTARIVRASYLSLKEQEFVEAARSTGVGPVRIAVRHILPGALGPVIASATLGIASAIMVESALSFLGLGFQPPQATWGALLFEAQRPVIALGHWWRGLFPGLMIFLVVLCVNYIGDGLRDAFDPRRRRR
ncbi:MAG: ABC transporter permease subunit [Streptosporangiales bacterium]|nr:ABC transporter permease subunit [Streptosporangiales bacterium]